MPLILDLSNNNPEPGWGTLKAHGVDAVYLKASEGNWFVDQTFAERRAAANRAGLLVGAYHFARPDQSDAATQARLFCRVVGKVGWSDLRPVLDFETGSARLPDSVMVSWARAFNRVVRDELGTLPLFYSYGAFLEDLHALAPIGAGLWLAAYGRNDGREYPFSVPSPWRAVVAHQFSSRCSIAGCSGLVDLSHAKSLRPLLAHPVKHAVAKVARGELKNQEPFTRKVA